MRLEIDPEAIVHLRPNLIVSVVAWRLALRLEAAGVQMRLDGTALMVGPKSLLADSDVHAIRQHRAELKIILAYQAPAQ